MNQKTKGTKKIRKLEEDPDSQQKHEHAKTKSMVSKKEKKGEPGKPKEKSEKDEMKKDFKQRDDAKKIKDKEKKKDKTVDTKDEMKSRRRLVKHGKFGAKHRDSGDVVAIDWDTEDGRFETKMDKRQLAISELEATINDLKRENMNLINELAHIKPDLDKKTEMMEKYDKRINVLKEDFERLKQRNLKEKKASMKYAGEKLILNMLEVLDNMDRAVAETKPEGDAAPVVNAVIQMRKQMLGVLEKEKVVPIDSVGKPFSPKYHDAMVQETDDTKPDNTVLEEFTKGYIYKDKVLRPAKVKVSKSDKIPAIKIEDEDIAEVEAEEDEEKKDERKATEEIKEGAKIEKKAKAKKLEERIKDGRKPKKDIEKDITKSKKRVDLEKSKKKMMDKMTLKKSKKSSK